MTTKECFTSKSDMAMRAEMLSIANQLYTGSHDVSDAGLVMLEQSGTSSAFPYMEGSGLLVRDMDSTSSFTLTSSLSQSDTRSRRMTLNVIIAETEVMYIPFDEASSQSKDRLHSLTMGGAVPAGHCEVKKRWAYNAFANTEHLGRDPHTMVALDGSSSIILYPDTTEDRIREFSSAKNISEGWLAQIPIPSKHELDVPRFNRIVEGLGFAGLRL